MLSLAMVSEGEMSLPQADANERDRSPHKCSSDALCTNTIGCYSLALLGCADVVLLDVAGTGTAVDQPLWGLDTPSLQIEIDTPAITVASDILQAIHSTCAETLPMYNAE